MTTSAELHEQLARDREIREQYAVSKDQLRRLHRFMAIGKAQVGGNATLPSSTLDEHPGEARITFTLSVKVPMTARVDGAERRYTAEAICISTHGVHVSARERPGGSVGNDQRAEPRWVPMIDVTHIEQAL